MTSAATGDGRPARAQRAGRASSGKAAPAVEHGASKFLGRERELGELAQLLERERLVTLSGAPGIGKSRLAVELAAGVAESFGGGTRLIELAPVARAVGVGRALAAALAVEEVAGQRLIDMIVSRLRARRMLVVLDNCEHLIGACAKLVEALLSGCPQLRILLTSREALGVDGEFVWQVGPLSVPGPEESGSPEGLENHAAVALFVERAAAAQPGFALNAYVAPAVAEICRRLDGIPLAIELAAARVESLTPQEIASRLDDRFALLREFANSELAHHQTLEAALDWSHELLSEGERTLLRRLSVFVGGFELEAAEAVCAGRELVADQVGGLLSDLVSKSLVVSGERELRTDCYRLLETIRAYAAERLEDAHETAALRELHASHFLAQAEQAEPELTGPDQTLWLRRLEADRPNLRSALEWSCSRGLGQWALRLTGSLVIFWYVRCHFSEGRDMLAAALAAGESEPLELRCKALLGAGFMTMMAGDFDGAVPAVKESAEAFSQLEDDEAHARALLILGNCHLYSDTDRALALFDQSAALARQTGDSWCLAHARGIAGMEYLYRGDVAAAAQSLAECVAVARDAVDGHSLQMGLIGLGQLRLVLGEYRLADQPLEEVVALAQELGDDYKRGWALQFLGQIFTGRGEYPRARDALDAGISLLREVRPADLIPALVVRARVARAAGEHREARGFLEEALTLARAGAPSPAPALLGIGELVAEQGDAQAARRLLEEGLDLARSSGSAASIAAALHGLGELARGEGEAERAGALHKEALQLRSESANTPGIVVSLEAFAGLAAEGGHHCHATRLVAAAEALRDRGGYARLPWESALYEHHLALVRRSLAAEEFEAAWAEGRSLSLDEAVAEALKDPGGDQLDESAWESLSDTDREIAALVAEGLTNREIAERLYMARATARNRLSHIFAKLGVSTRSELGARVWRRRERRSPNAPARPPPRD